ncbi:reverse transcriptase domain-containing protein [Tanacetum coccineum]
MSAAANTTPIVTTVTKTANKEKTQKERDKVNIQNFCEEHYEDILPIIMDKVRRDKRKEVHTRLDFAESSETGSYDGVYSSQGTRTKYRGPTRDRRRSRSTKRWREDESPSSRGSKSSTSDTGHWKSRGKRSKTLKEDLVVPWSCEEVDPFTPRIRNFKSSRKTRMPNNVKTYDGTGDPEDHLKVFQASAQVERWAMPTWCHMFNSTLIGAARVWFDELPPESIDSYKDLKAAFLAYFMQQKKHVKDPVEIHNIKQKDRETIEEFMERFKVETGRMKGAPECMKIFGFMHELKQQVEELVKAGKLSHFIKEIREDRDKLKKRKNEAPAKEKAAAIYMIQPRHRVTQQKVTLSFA